MALGLSFRSVAEESASSLLPMLAATLFLCLPTHAQRPDLDPHHYPAVPGTYHPLTQHPGVFTTNDELHQLATKINQPGTFSAKNFASLAQATSDILHSTRDWTATYSGCSLKAYLWGFSYQGEPPADIVANMQQELTLRSGAMLPSGAAYHASILARYAALLHAGAHVPPNAPTEEQAITLARSILLAWAQHGFRDDNTFRTDPTHFCDIHGKFPKLTAQEVGLQISRGVVYSVDTEDLLDGLHALTPEDAHSIDALHLALYDTIRNSMNIDDGYTVPLNMFGNHRANDIAGMLAIARVTNDRDRFLAALNNAVPSIPVAIPFTVFFSNAIYGTDQQPNGGYTNSAEIAGSHARFQTPTAFPGEIDDRFRNDEPYMGIGYSMFTVQRLFYAAEVLRHAGFYPYAYTGTHQQTLRLPMHFFACYEAHASFGAIITTASAASCMNPQQYVGKTLDTAPQALFAAWAYPADLALQDAAAKAEIFPGSITLDTIFLGHWPGGIDAPQHPR